MNIAFLGPSESPLIGWLRAFGENVTVTMEPIDNTFLDAHLPEFIVSYGYRHILRKEILTRYTDRAINLHISYLPWNKGAHPNFWSFIEKTPKGVTIHYMDKGIDTGDIIVQKETVFNRNEILTLKTTQDKLHEDIRALFKENWINIRNGKCNRTKQNSNGTFHKAKDLEKYSNTLIDGWNTPISVISIFSV